MIPYTNMAQPQETDPFAQYGGRLDTSISFDPANASPSSPAAGGGGFTGGMTGTPTASGQPWDQAYFASTFGTPKTPQELIALEAQITAAGGKVLRNAAGVAGKIQTPDGRIIDVINAAGAGGQGFQWLEGGGGGQNGSSLGSLGYGFGDSMKPIDMQYNLPSLSEFQASPFYGAGLDAFNRANQNSAAARGTLLNGRTNEAMNKSAMDYGLTQYSTLAGLNSGVFDRNYAVRKDNRDSPFEKNLSLAKLGYPS